jgi:hypothetical protein
MSAVLNDAARKIVVLVGGGGGSAGQSRRWQDKSSAVLRRADGWFPWRFRAARHIEATALPKESRVFPSVRAPSLRCNTGQQVRE